MTKKEVKKEPTRLIAYFVMVYCHLLTASDEAAPPDDSIPVDISDSDSTNNTSTTEAAAELHSVIKIIQEKELGKTVIALAIPIAMAAVVAGKDRLAESEMRLILILVSLGFAAILNGILLKEAYPRFAKIAEPLGIVVVAVSFYAIIAFFLPAELSWLPVLCICFCLLPFAVAVWQPAPPPLPPST